MQITKQNNALIFVQIFQLIHSLKIIPEFVWMFAHLAHLVAQKFYTVFLHAGGLIMQIQQLIFVFRYVRQAISQEIKQQLVIKIVVQTHMRIPIQECVLLSVRFSTICLNTMKIGLVFHCAQAHTIQIKI
jgi:hypothetical protein